MTEILRENQIIGLFGWPVNVSDRSAGRPEHEWSLENSNVINAIFADNGSIADAALVLGISQPTLRKHYFSEVSGFKLASRRALAHALSLLWQKAETGDTSAIDKLLKRLDRADLLRQGSVYGVKVKTKMPKLGKKEQRIVDAAKAHEASDWAGLLDTGTDLLN
jgi:hypothetical protein